MIQPRHRLQYRLMLVFAGFTLLVTGLLSLFAVMFVYVVEDRLLESMLGDEAAYLVQQHREHGQWIEPRHAYMRLVRGTESLPEDLREQFMADPQRSEFAGEHGRHYHLLRLNSTSAEPPLLLLAEVSAQLVVRPVRQQMFNWLAGWAIGFVVLALILGVWLARRTAAPMTALSELVAGMKPDRLPRGFAERFGEGEVGVLARGLEGLIARISWLIERERAFSRDASHELRTPLAVIRSMAERLLAEPQLSPAGAAHLEHLRQSTQLMQQTIATLLFMARTESPLQLDEPVALLPIVERVVVEQAVLLEGKLIDVKVDVAASAMATVQPSALHIILCNLIGNAFAHTAQGLVSIELDGWQLRISNSGQGIDPALQSSLFQPFSKGEGSAGFGLGLSIVQRLCEHYRLGLVIRSDADATMVELDLQVAMEPSNPAPRATRA